MAWNSFFSNSGWRWQLHSLLFYRKLLGALTFKYYVVKYLGLRGMLPRYKILPTLQHTFIVLLLQQLIILTLISIAPLYISNPILEQKTIRRLLLSLYIINSIDPLRIILWNNSLLQIAQMWLFKVWLLDLALAFIVIHVAVVWGNFCGFESEEEGCADCRFWNKVDGTIELLKDCLADAKT